MKTFAKLALLSLPLTAMGCSSAGPYVTDISSDGEGGVNVTKCSVEFNAFTSTVSNHDCTARHILLASKLKTHHSTF
ncbi:hypothetical protein ACWX0P_27345 [Vibrio mediterranei]